MNDKPSLEDEIAAVKQELADADTASSKPKPEGARKMVKKVKKVAKSTKAPPVKKVAKKTNGAEKSASTEGLVTLTQLAEEAKISPQSARVKLRAADIDRGDGRWKFEEGSKRLRQAREILGLS
jgi:HPt (histidine-containing phosphotransfer) domain-containing protein